MGAAGLCALGLGVAGKLALLHYEVHQDPATESFCALSERVNCDTVAASVWSVFAGVPVAVWGLLGYLWLGALALGTRRGRGPAELVLFTLGAAGACGVSVLLAAVSVIEIRSLCVLCLSSYVINALLLTLGLRELRRRGGFAPLWREPSRVTQARGFAVVTLVAFGALAAASSLWFPKYWRGEALAVVATTGKGVASGASGSGTTPEGHAWLGATSPELTIVEFSDYECPFCARAHTAIRQVVRAHAGRVRLVHRHFPLDQACNPIVKRPFHGRACELAAIAVCAGRQGKFWEVNDWLYQQARTQPPTVDAVAVGCGLDRAALTDCLAQGIETLLGDDLEEGVRRGITGTPTFLIGEELYPGSVPAGLLDSLLGRPSG